MIEIAFLIMSAIVASLLASRISEFPFRLRASVTETAANTYTRTAVNLPVAILRGGQVQAVEAMKAVYRIPLPDVEAGQANQIIMQWTRDQQTAALGLESDQVIDMAERSQDGTTVTSVGELLDAFDPYVFHDLTDGDGKGQLLLERSIEVGIVGGGNANAKNVRTYLLCHLIELTGNEAAAQMFVDDA